MMLKSEIVCIADKNQKSRELCQIISSKYGFQIIKDANNNLQAKIVLVFGGDGFMLRCMHKFMFNNVLLYGINTGQLGFLMNHVSAEDDIMEKLENLSISPIHPLVGSILLNNGQNKTLYAINEISLFRQTYQTANLSLDINNKIYIEKLICDGLLVATPAGSSAYNYSAGGPIIPLNTNLLALTPLNIFRPRRWKGALLPSNVKIKIIVNEKSKRPVSAVADFKEIRNIQQITIIEDKNIHIKLGFSNENNLEFRLFKEQFVY